jgi:hypothetical protein
VDVEVDVEEDGAEVLSLTGSVAAVALVKQWKWTMHEGLNHINLTTFNVRMS